MCLAIPGRVTDTYAEHEVLMGKVDFSGVTRSVCLEHVPEVNVGEYVLVHVGFALQKVDETEAKLVFDFLEQMDQLDELETPQEEKSEIRSTKSEANLNKETPMAQAPRPPTF